MRMRKRAFFKKADFMRLPIDRNGQFIVYAYFRNWRGLQIC